VLVAALAALAVLLLSGGDSTGPSSLHEANASLQRLNHDAAIRLRTTKRNPDAADPSAIAALQRRTAELQRRIAALSSNGRPGPGVDRLDAEVKQLAGELDVLLRAVRTHDRTVIVSTSQDLIVRFTQVAHDGDAVVAGRPPKAPAAQPTQHLTLGQTAALAGRYDYGSLVGRVDNYSARLTVTRVVPLKPDPTVTTPNPNETHVAVFARLQNTSRIAYSGYKSQILSLITSSGRHLDRTTFGGTPAECTTTSAASDDVKVKPGAQTEFCLPFTLRKGETPASVRGKLYVEGGKSIGSADWRI
jgi:hypothetical protein